MGYEKYAARFVMLEEQSNIFALRSTLPIKGHIKIETGNSKGAMRVVAQNMRYYERGPYVYKMILFGKRKEKTIHSVMGTVVINRYGNGETYIRFNPLDVDGKGNPLSAFSVAIVVAVSVRNEKESLHPVLKGDLAAEEEYAAAGPAGTEPAAGGAAGEYESAAEGSAGGKPAGAKPAAGEAVEGEGPAGKGAAGAGDESPGDISASPGPRFKRGGDRAKVQEGSGARRSYNDFYSRYLIESCQRTVQMSRYYDNVIPFQKDKTKARWKKIVNVANLPVVSPGARYFASKYRHYIFGITEGTCYIGIPGRLMNEEQPDGGESGFVFWQPITGAPELRDAYGYWIVGIDMMTGDVVEV